MLDDWNITHERGDLPPEVWDFLKTRGFFAMIIPKKYGGLEFSACAHSCVLAKIATRSATASSTVAVPNSLGPAELLLRYGTEEQKNHYLPRLAAGEEVPCFALTGPARRLATPAPSPTPASCAEALCQGTRSSWHAAQLRQALHHAGAGGDRPRPRLSAVRSRTSSSARVETSASPARSSRVHTPGVQIGRRHFPLNIPFQNGPIQRQGRVRAARLASSAGRSMAGQGWRMLMECSRRGPRHLAALQRHRRRAGCGVDATGAYARIRKQFGLPIGRFDGRRRASSVAWAATLYTIEAARRSPPAPSTTARAPACAAAISEVSRHRDGRHVANDAMDVHGGKGISLGPRNYLGRGYQVGADRHHRRGRQHPDAQPHHLRPGRASAAIRLCCAR